MKARWMGLAVLAVGLVLAAAPPSARPAARLPRLKSLRVATYVEPSAGAVRARVVLTSRRTRAKAASVVLALLRGRAVVASVGHRRLAASRAYAARTLWVAVDISSTVPRGNYALRACVARSCVRTPLTIVGVPKGYEGVVTLHQYAAYDADALTIDFSGRLAFTRSATAPGIGLYDVAGGSGTFTVAGTTAACPGGATGTVAGTTDVTFPAGTTLPTQGHELTVFDGRVGTLSGATLDPAEPYYWAADVEGFPALGGLFSATRTCPDGSHSVWSFDGYVYLRVGPNPPWIPYEPEGVLRAPPSAALVGTAYDRLQLRTTSWDLEPVG
jgi:hypothetical protein